MIANKKPKAKHNKDSHKEHARNISLYPIKMIQRLYTILAHSLSRVSKKKIDREGWLLLQSRDLKCGDLV